jgi:transposase
MDLTDAQWEILEPMFRPKRRSDGRGRPWRDARAVFQGVLWILRTGAQWRELPSKYPPYQTCHRRFQSWQRSGLLTCVLQKLVEDLRDRGKIDLSETFIDASFSSAKKGALLSARLAEEKVVKSWRSQTAMVFLSPAASPALRLMKANSSKRPSRSVSREPNQIE